MRIVSIPNAAFIGDVEVCAAVEQQLDDRLGVVFCLDGDVERRLGDRVATVHVGTAL